MRRDVMPANTIEEAVRRQLNAIYRKLRNDSLEGGNRVTARSVFKIAEQTGIKVSESKVQKLVANWKNRDIIESVWKPWGDEPEMDAAGTAFTIGLGNAYRLLAGRRMTNIEAGWAANLRPMLENHHRVVQALCVLLYADRQLMGVFNDTDYPTDDLDTWLSFRAEYGKDDYASLAARRTDNKSWLPAPATLEEVRAISEFIGTNLQGRDTPRVGWIIAGLFENTLSKGETDFLSSVADLPKPTLDEMLRIPIRVLKTHIETSEGDEKCEEA